MVEISQMSYLNQYTDAVKLLLFPEYVHDKIYTLESTIWEFF